MPVVRRPSLAAAVRVSARSPQWKSPTAIPKSNRPRQGVTDPPVLPRHGSWSDTAEEPVSHHQVVALAQARKEWHQVAEVIAAVSIAHHQVAPSGRGKPATQGATVATIPDLDHASASCSRQLAGAVGAAVVGDQDLSCNTVTLQRGDCLSDAARHGFHLVEARDDH